MPRRVRLPVTLIAPAVCTGLCLFDWTVRLMHTLPRRLHSIVDYCTPVPHAADPAEGGLAIEYLKSIIPILYSAV